MSPVKKACTKLVLQLTPSVLRFLSPQKPKPPAEQASPVKLIGNKATGPAGLLGVVDLTLPAKATGKATGKATSKATIRATSKATGKTTGKAIGKAIGKAVGKAVGKASAPGKSGCTAKSVQEVLICGKTVEPAVEPVVDQVTRTQSGRAPVKRVIFDAGKN